ncbi:hypothetical protein SLEP1_g34200 [Rubroshorea leprosula]|uniref:Uncharacterized protein n=1 Tax=Rubroshorea leprosula TaxID=152421 RepID=A0AAV5KJB7_9ROSI|nr:hypothetical protein SLEP1_g34200 [Rubroshorea leprosula]
MFQILKARDNNDLAIASETLTQFADRHAANVHTADNLFFVGSYSKKLFWQLNHQFSVFIVIPVVMLQRRIFPLIKVPVT